MKSILINFEFSMNFTLPIIDFIFVTINLCHLFAMYYDTRKKKNKTEYMLEYL